MESGAVWQTYAADPRGMSLQPQHDGDPLAPHSLSAAELKDLLAAERAGNPFLAYRDELGLLRIFPVSVADLPLPTAARASCRVPNIRFSPTTGVRQCRSMSARM